MSQGSLTLPDIVGVGALGVVLPRPPPQKRIRVAVSVRHV